MKMFKIQHNKTDKWLGFKKGKYNQCLQWSEEGNLFSIDYFNDLVDFIKNSNARDAMEHGIVRCYDVTITEENAELLIRKYSRVHEKGKKIYKDYSEGSDIRLLRDMKRYGGCKVSIRRAMIDLIFKLRNKGGVL